eukprot:1683699-Karenia_brevis.AAC.1
MKNWEDDTRLKLTGAGYRLLCHRCGQHWQDQNHYIGDLQCLGPEIWGLPQRDRPWIVPQRHPMGSPQCP